MTNKSPSAPPRIKEIVRGSHRERVVSDREREGERGREGERERETKGYKGYKNIENGEWLPSSFKQVSIRRQFLSFLDTNYQELAAPWVGPSIDSSERGTGTEKKEK
jgi:hypothetical protein